MKRNTVVWCEPRLSELASYETLTIMAEAKNLYSIVVVGWMNPRIHHPSWYHSVGLISQEELEAAVNSPNTFTIPPMAQFQIPNITVICQDERWEIKSDDQSQCERIVSITSRLFDELLPHTPVNAAGFNFHHPRETKCQDVGAYLASILVKAPLGLTEGNSVSGEITLRRTFDDHTSFATIKNLLNENNKCYIHYNYEYKFVIPGFFKLGEFFARRYEVDRQDAEEQTSRIVEAINQSSQD